MAEREPATGWVCANDTPAFDTGLPAASGDEEPGQSRVVLDARAPRDAQHRGLGNPGRGGDRLDQVPRHRRRGRPVSNAGVSFAQTQPALVTLAILSRHRQRRTVSGRLHGRLGGRVPRSPPRSAVAARPARTRWRCAERSRRRPDFYFRAVHQPAVYTTTPEYETTTCTVRSPTAMGTGRIATPVNFAAKRVRSAPAC